MRRNSKLLIVAILLLPSLFVFSKPAKADITTGLVGHWAFDEGSGTAAADSFGGHNGTISGATWTTGKIGTGALQFGGTANVSVGAHVFDAPPVSVCAWVYLSSAGGNHQVIVNNVSFDLEAMESDGADMIMLYNNNGGVSTPYSSRLAFNSWYHICGVVDPSNNGSIYVNGSLAASPSNIGTSYTAYNLFIGASYPGTSGFFPGQIDDVRIYNRVLSTADISELYAYTGGSSGGGGPDTQAPTVPSNLAATAVSPTSVNLSWMASTDNVAVTGYKIYRGALLVGTPATNSYSDTGLTANTAYSYSVSAYDAAGNTSAQSTPASITTPVLDTTPPVISGINASNLTSSSATITWTTDESSDSQVEYGLTTSYGSVTTLDSSLVTNHSVSLTSLSANTVYHYRVKSKDSSGNLATSPDGAFTTTAVGVGGSIYYVRTDGNNGNTGQTNNSGGAWRNIDYAANHVSAGSTIRVQAGTYVEAVSPGVSGTPGNVITIVADGTVTTCSMAFSSRAYIRVIGFVIDPTTAGCSNPGYVVLVSGTNSFLEFWNNTMANADAGWRMPNTTDRCTSCIIFGGSVHNINNSGMGIGIIGNDSWVGYVDFATICYLGVGPSGSRMRFINLDFSGFIQCGATHPDLYYFNGFSPDGYSNSLIESNYGIGTVTASDNKAFHAQNEQTNAWHDDIWRLGVTYNLGSGFYSMY